MTSILFTGTTHIQGEGIIQSMQPRGQELWDLLRNLTTTNINDEANRIFVNTELGLYFHSHLPPGNRITERLEFHVRLPLSIEHYLK